MGVIEFVLALVVVTLMFGWATNISKLANDTGNFSGRSALRIAGIFIFPLGGILGYFGENE